MLCSDGNILVNIDNKLIACFYTTYVLGYNNHHNYSVQGD